MNFEYMEPSQLAAIIEAIPPIVREKLTENVYLAGGAIRDIVMKRDPRDYDLYYTGFHHGPFEAPVTEVVDGIKIQKISLHQLNIEKFDFSVNCASVKRVFRQTYAGLMHPKFFEDVEARQLRIQHFDARSFFARLARMCSYGFVFPNTELARVIATIVKGLPSTTVSVEQLYLELCEKYRWSKTTIQHPPNATLRTVAADATVSMTHDEYLRWIEGLNNEVDQTLFAGNQEATNADQQTVGGTTRGEELANNNQHEPENGSRENLSVPGSIEELRSRGIGATLTGRSQSSYLAFVDSAQAAEIQRVVERWNRLALQDRATS